MDYFKLMQDITRFHAQEILCSDALRQDETLNESSNEDADAIASQGGCA